MVAHLEAEFAALQRSKDATPRTLEPRVRNMRYVAELSKFRVFPHGAAFSMLKALLDDFSGHNIDAACAMVETAGRFFYRWAGWECACGAGRGTWRVAVWQPRHVYWQQCWQAGAACGARLAFDPAAHDHHHHPPDPSFWPPLSPPYRRLPETSTRTANFLEVMMKLRNARNLDARQSGLVDSAYFAVRAADRGAKRKQREPEQEYIRYLVYERLPLGQITKVGGCPRGEARREVRVWRVGAGWTLQTGGRVLNRIAAVGAEGNERC